MSLGGAALGGAAPGCRDITRGDDFLRIFILCCALLGFGGTCAAETRVLPGFRLLVLDEQLARWQRGSTVTYAFLEGPEAFPSARNCGAMVPVAPMLARSRVTFARFKREAASAFRMWAHAANIGFREIADSSRADIVIGAQAEPRGRAFTNVALKEDPPSGAPAIDRSLICLNPDVSWKIGFDGNLAVYDLRYTLAHEIGHAIGLDHPGAAGQLMSYRYDELHAALREGDIAGARRLYGPRTPDRLAAFRAPPSLKRATAPARPRTPSALGLGEPPSPLKSGR